jgi:hypothetical protein
MKNNRMKKGFVRVINKRIGKGFTNHPQKICYNACALLEQLSLPVVWLGFHKTFIYALIFSAQREKRSN